MLERRFPFFAALLMAAAFPILSVHADKVTYNAGAGTQQTQEGAIVSETADEIQIELDFEQILPIAAKDIVEIKKGDHPVVQCRELCRKAEKAKTVDAWLELARLAQASKPPLNAYKRKACQEAVALDPANEEAQKGLGKVKHEGKWITPSDQRRAQQWNQKVGNMQREYTGRPWATVAPIKTNYFVMKCGSTDDVEKQYRAFLENALFPLYNKTFPKEKFTWHNPDPGKIYIMANAGQFREYMLVPMGIGGFFIPAKNEVYAFHGSFGIRGTTLHVLAHEACHVYQWRIFKDMNAAPTWLLEGMATYFGDGAKFGFSFRDDPKEFRPAAVEIVPPYDRVILLKRMIQAGASAYLPLYRLLQVPHLAFNAAYYSNGWLVVFWCLDGEKHGAHKGEGRRLLDEYILHVSTLAAPNGTNDPRHLKAEADVFAGLVKKHLGKSLESWDEDLKKFVTDLKLDPLGTWTASSRKWKGLGLDLTCPAPLTLIDQQALLPGEVVAFGPKVGDHPRITVWAISNDFLVRTEKETVSRWIEELYEVEEWVKEAEPVAAGGSGMVEAVFKGKRRVERLPDEQKPKERPTVSVRFRATATPSKVYFFGCESAAKSFDANFKGAFETFFKNVKLAGEE